MARTGSAHEVNPDITWPRFPGLLQEVFQWKPKPKGKKQKSQIDDTRTEISYTASTAAGDADFETSTYVSKDLGTPSSRSMESKRSKKRSKKSLKDTSGSVYSEAISSSPATPEVSNREATPAPSYLVTLTCPLCYDPDCILNKAAQCPLLRHNEPQVNNTSDRCTFCASNCRCEELKKTLLPVSGLVQRDENGIAETLLKANGGPIENSYEWANRRRWDVPSHIRWEHQISEWITAPTHGHTKSEEAGHRKKSHRSKNKRKSRATPSALTATPDITSNSEERRMEEDDQETKLVLEGNGFKIYSKGHEKILINYDRKNCKYLGCSCLPAVDLTNCGCGDKQVGRERTATKHHKNCKNRQRKISLLKETSHGMEPIQRELEEKYAKEKAKSCDSEDKSGTNGKCDESSNPKLKTVNTDKKEIPNKNPKNEKDSDRKVNLTGKDLRNRSRADILESSLRNMLGDDYKKGGGAEKCGTGNLHKDQYVNIPCPGSKVLSSIRMRKISQRNGQCCRFVEVVERLPKCPCDNVPPLPTGPPCPFTAATGGQVASALQSLLQQSTTQESENCSLTGNLGGKTESSQLCVFSQPGPIDFKSLPRYTCSCAPGTCPELAKNFIRSLGFDPMCTCPCPQTIKAPQPEPIEKKKKTKRRKKDRTKSTPDVSKTEVSAKSSTDQLPSPISANMLGAGGENQKKELPTPVQQDAGVVGGSTSPEDGIAGGTTMTAAEVAGGVTTRDTGGTVKPHPAEPKGTNYSADSGPSNGTLLLEGKGFKIFEINGEKVLLNYSTKNCPLLKCKCSRKDEDSCGCSEWVRLTKYTNCVCPGARKVKKSPPVLKYAGDP